MIVLKWSIGAGAVLALLVGLWLFWPRAVGDVQDRAVVPLEAGKGVVVLGTSLSHKDWPKTLGGLCRSPVTQVTKPGANAYWGLEQVHKAIAAKPALVLVEFAINDADILDGLSKEESRQALEQIITALEAGLPEAEVVLMTMNPVTGVTRLQRPFLAGYYGIVRDVADARGLGLIDLEPRWQGALEVGEVIPDGVHPTRDSFARVALPAIAAALGCGD